MAQTKDLRLRSSAPSSPGSSVVTFYADSSGILKSVDTNGTVRYVAGHTSVATTGVPQSLANFGAMGTAAAELSGFFGGSGVYMGKPSIFVSIVGSGGVTYLLPAYASA